MYLEDDGFTYQFVNYHIHEGAHQTPESGPEGQHVIRTKFVGANPSPTFEELKPAPFYENYLLGNDPAKWVNHLSVYNEVHYVGLYDNIDLHLYENDQTLKYDVIVHSGGDPAQFRVSYKGQDDLHIKKDAVVIETKLGNIVEGKPRAYQLVGGFKVEVACKYKLEGNEMHFEFPDGYNESTDLIIDPDLTFSTFTGSTSDNWGMTACPDVDKNLIAAGIVFGSGYPVVSGFDGSYEGGMPSTVDIGLTKFNATGTHLFHLYWR